LLYLQRNAFGSELSKSIKRIPVKVGQGMGGLYCRVSNVKYTDYAFNKTTVYKRKSRNHLSDQIESFRIGDKDNKREDDLLDTFCYGIAIALGNSEGF
jgi:hypothetical protein